MEAVQRNLAVAYITLERLDEAEDTLQRAFERKLDIPDYYVLRYVIAFLKGDKAAMEREAALAERRRGVDDWMSNAEGFALAYSGRLKAAREMSRRAADLARRDERRDTEALYQADAAVREALFGNGNRGSGRDRRNRWWTAIVFPGALH